MTFLIPKIIQKEWEHSFFQRTNLHFHILKVRCAQSVLNINQRLHFGQKMKITKTIKMIPTLILKIYGNSNCVYLNLLDISGIKFSVIKI